MQGCGSLVASLLPVDLALVGVACWGGWLLMVASVAAIRAGDAGASVAYYVDQVSLDRHDYYAGYGEAPGVWHGAFAEHLGLSGNVAADDFRAVLEGRDPISGEALKSRTNRRVAAWDVTFSPPKSISALWALAPEDAREQVRQAQAAAVDAAIGYLTAHACVARLSATASTGRTAPSWGSCGRAIHRCSREGDPQVHTHSILVNLLQAPTGAALHSTAGCCSSTRRPPTASTRRRCAPYCPSPRALPRVQARGRGHRVRNGMTGRVTATRRRYVTIELEPLHARPADPPA